MNTGVMYLRTNVIFICLNPCNNAFLPTKQRLSLNLATSEI